MGAHAVLVPLTVDQQQSKLLAAGAADSASHARAKVATQWFDDMRNGAKGLNGGVKSEQAIIYTLIGALPPARSDLHSVMSFKVSSGSRYSVAGFKDIDAVGKGKTVSEIDGGMFDVDSLVQLNDGSSN
jgi:hypothetical protein